MRRNVLAVLGGLLCCLVLPRLAYSQLPVTDAGNLTVNSITSANAVITATEAVVQTANMFLELTPLQQVILRRRLIANIELMGEIFTEAEALAYDLQSLQAQLNAMFDLQTAPNTRDGLTARLAEIRQYQARQRSLAARTQTLLRTTQKTIEHLLELMDSLLELLGNMQSNQTLIQQQASIQQTLLVMQMQDATFQRTDTMDRMADAVIIESLNKIALKLLEDHPRY